MKPYSEVLGQCSSPVLALCEDIGTPRALTVAILLRHGEFDELAKLEVHPQTYLNGWRYRDDAIVTNLFRKTEDLPTTFDREAEAVENFWKSERKCLSTNMRLAPLLDGFYGENPMDPNDEGVRRFFDDVRKMVKDILGPLPEFRALEPLYIPPTREGTAAGVGQNKGRNRYVRVSPRPPDVLLEGRFGPGATYADRGRYTTLPDKMSSNPTLTSECWPCLFQWSGTAWASACAASRRDPTFVSGNRFTTVPKDCRKDRGIAVEPSINLYYQLAFGRYLKSRLKRSGIDLKEGQTIHRRMACEASKSRLFATLDLSNASDTVCTNLVKLVLPPTWFEALNMLRSPTTEIVKSHKPSFSRCEGNARVLLEKFSSMGNGFTFELETLIFLSICLVAVRQKHWTDPIPGVDVFVYGDDIIIPTDCAEDVISALRYCGFDLNDKNLLSRVPSVRVVAGIIGVAWTFVRTTLRNYPMNHNTISPLLMAYAIWVVQTLMVILTTIGFCGLGYASWMLYRVISAGLVALNI